MIRVFVHELDYPVVTSYLPLTEDTGVETENHLAWLAFCVNGSQSDHYDDLGMYWLTSYGTDQQGYPAKTSNLLNPPPSYCTSYYKLSGNT
jgi:hypothetical protein